jgi:zinc and cadmium transporter
MEFSPFLWTFIGNIAIAVWIVIVVFFVKFVKNKLIDYIDYITALTVWLLLWIIFLWFFPELVHSFGEDWLRLGLYLLFGLFIFYLFDLFLHWHHCKDLSYGSDCHHSHVHSHKNSYMMLWWTLLHNVFHGIVLFSAFSVDFHFWIAMTFTVLLHAIPQNIANYIMNHNDIKYSYFAAFGGIIWALLTFPFSSFLIWNQGVILAMITWGLLYTALSDILPEFKGRGTVVKKFAYLFFMVLWVVGFFYFDSLIEHTDFHNDDVVEYINK